MKGTLQQENIRQVCFPEHREMLITGSFATDFINWNRVKYTPEPIFINQFQRTNVMVIEQTWLG